MKKSTNRKGVIFCLVGPSGSGKSSIAKELLATDPLLARSISCTTRKPRPNEQDGVSYHFLSKEIFLQRIAKGEFFEYEEVHSELYGTLKSSVAEIFDSGRDLILDIDVRGARSFKQTSPDSSTVIFILPPSKQAIVERVMKRGGVEQQELERRLETAKLEMQALNDCDLLDYTVLNCNLENCLIDVRAIIRAERLRSKRVSTDVKI